MKKHIMKEKNAAFVMQCLDEHERELIEAHLDDCPKCKNEVGLLSRIHEELRDAGEEGFGEVQGKVDRCCPEINALHNFLTGTSGWFESKRIKQHFVECTSCSYLITDYLKEDNQWIHEESTPSSELLCSLERIPEARDGYVKSASERAFGSFRSLRVRPSFLGTAAAVALAMWAILIFLPQYPLSVKSDFMAETSYLTRSTRTIPLMPGSVLYSGDAFFLNVRTNRNAFIYLIGYDSQGKCTQIFPAEGLTPANPLLGKKSYRIPDGKAWPLDEHIGTETVFLAASEGPVGDIKSIVKEMNQIKNEGRLIRQEAVERMEELLKEHFAAIDVLSFEHK